MEIDDIGVKEEPFNFISKNVINNKEINKTPIIGIEKDKKKTRQTENQDLKLNEKSSNIISSLSYSLPDYVCTLDGSK